MQPAADGGRHRPERIPGGERAGGPAENHPERVLGLIFVQPVFVFTDIKDEAT